MRIIESDFFTLRFTWCRNCGEVFGYFQYSANLDYYSSESVERENTKEENKRKKFEAEHNENCKKEKEIVKITELISIFQQKFPEFQKRKAELENSFTKDVLILEDIFDRYDFFRQLINSTFWHFRQTLGKNLFPYASSYIIFNGFVESSSYKGWVNPNIFRYKSKSKSIMRQTFSLSINKKYKKELTELDSQIPGYDFFRFVETLAHEISHCLLGDFFRIHGHSGEYSHQFEWEKLTLIVKDYLWTTQEIQFLLPLQIDFLREKINYFEEKIQCLQEEEKETKLLPDEKIRVKRKNHDKNKEVMSYLANLKIIKEKIEEKIIF